MSAILVLMGGLCLYLSGWAMYRLVPREGKPRSSWVATDTRATTVTMAVLVLLVAGIVLVLKGLL